MKEKMIINNLQQLKAISDPIRAKIMMQLVMYAYTGQQLAGILNLPRGKVHYHLKDLEKNKLIEIVKTEEKNGIVQKFYQAMASDFQISEDLLPRRQEVSNATKQFMYGILERAKQAVQSAPLDAFEAKKPDEDPIERSFISTTWELEATEEQFSEWKRKYYALLEDLSLLGRDTEDTKQNYYITTIGFQTDKQE